MPLSISHRIGLTVFDEELRPVRPRPAGVAGAYAVGRASLLGAAVLQRRRRPPVVGAYENGRRVSRYASSVREFEDANEFPPIANFATELCRAFDRTEQVNPVRGVLRRSHGALGLLRLVHLNIAYVVEIQRHADLAKLAGLPAASVGLGYTCVACGQLAEGMQAENLLRTFGRTTN